ncbi:MAG: ChaN family lipoprotein, partial [Candidatus Aminicenantes bacterium]
MAKNIRFKIFFCFAFFGLLSLFTVAHNSDEDQDKYLRLNIGLPELKDKILSVSPDRLYDMSSGQTIEFPRMIDHMISSRFIYIGETHNSLPMHDIQLEIVRALYEKDRRIAIGLEMVPVSLQHVLNKWSLGILTEDELVQHASWYETWNFNFKFYEKIFAFAKLNRIPLYGLNIPKGIITKIRMQGWD